MYIICNQFTQSQTQGNGFTQFSESKADNLLGVLGIMGLEHAQKTETR